MLHVHGGSVLLERLKAAGLPGEFLEWCDVLCQGPTPADLTPEAWRTTRAAYLDRTFSAIDHRTNLDRLIAQDRSLARALDHDEVVLWFGPDLFCQAILIYLLNWFASRSLSKTRLALLCIGSYPNVDDHHSCTPAFLSSEQLREVFRQRRTVSGAELGLGRRSWEAFSSPAPTALEKFVAENTAPLPYLRDALLRHLQEFPSLKNGLNLTEARILELARGGERNPLALYEAFQQLERRRWLTDVMFLARLRDLAAGPAPLLELGDAERWRRGLDSMQSLARETVHLTEAGEEVLAGRQDWVTLGRLDRWLGGVQLTPAAPWRWDTEHERFVYRTPPV